MKGFLARGREKTGVDIVLEGNLAVTDSWGGRRERWEGKEAFRTEEIEIVTKREGTLGRKFPEKKER